MTTFRVPPRDDIFSAVAMRFTTTVCGEQLDCGTSVLLPFAADQAQLLALPVESLTRMTTKRIKRTITLAHQRVLSGTESFRDQWREVQFDPFKRKFFRQRNATNKRKVRRYKLKHPKETLLEVQGGTDQPTRPFASSDDKFTGRLKRLMQSDHPLFEHFSAPTQPVSPMAYFSRVRQCFNRKQNHTAKSIIGKYTQLNQSTDMIIDELETFCIFQWQFYRAQTLADRMVCIAALAKVLNEKLNLECITIAVLKTAADHFLTPEVKKGSKLEVQSFDFLSLDGVECWLEMYERIKESPMYKKMYKFTMYVLSLSMFSRLGFTMDLLRFEPCAQAAIKAKYHLGADFVVTMLDTMVFMCRRGYQCYVTGSMEPLFHSGDKYQEWYDEAEKLNRQSQFLSNAREHGIDKFAFLSDLKTAIEKGHCIKKFVQKKEDKIMIGRLLSKLEYNYDMEVTKRASQKIRSAPFSILVHGGSSVGKSSFVDICIKHYGKVRGLRTTSDYRYVRNPGADFWDGYDTSKWCIVLDDIAYLNPAMGVMDASLQELLWIVNNTPYVPNQAALEDKGRTPLMCEFAVGTTNTMNLNTSAYFACPFAVQRRFPYVLSIAPKREYQSIDKPGMLASHLRPDAPADTYDDLWDIRLLKVVPAGCIGDKQMGRHELVETFDTMPKFLVWFNSQIHEHHRIQDIVKSSLDSAQEVTLCRSCELPRGFCSCLSTQADDGETPSWMGDASAANSAEPSQIHDIPPWMNVPVDQSLIEEEVRYPSFLECCELDTKLVIWYYSVLYYCIYSPWYINAICTYFLGTNWFWRKVWSSTYKGKIVRSLFGYMGQRVQNTIGYPKALVTVAAALGATYMMYRSIKCLVGSTSVLDTQGGVHSVDSYGTVPEPDLVQKPFVSYQSDMAMNADDYSQHTLSSKGQDPNVLKRYIGKAAVFVSSHQDIDGKKFIKNTSAVNVRGNVYMMNNHGIFPTAPFLMDIIDETNVMRKGLSNVMITEDMIHRIPEKDLAFIKIQIRPPGSDLTSWFVKSSYNGRIDGYYHGRHINGQLWEEPVRNLNLITVSWRSHDLQVTNPVWAGKVSNPTCLGDCGTLLIGETPAGRMILGIHTLGRDNDINCLRVTQETVKSACDKLEPSFINRGFVEISAPSKKRSLGPLYSQSVTHQVPNGSANIMGSFQDFRQQPKTNVIKTYIYDKVVEFGYTCDKVAPTFGKKPWILALQDMTRPVTLLRNDVLVQAKRMFIEEVKLKTYAGVKVYNLGVALNGAPGVRYCDKLNRKTSAGCPYKCPKTRFLYFLDDGTTDVGVVEEIKDEVQRIIDIYHSGSRAHPVYCGHPKDEPLSQEKALLGKIRIFTASSMAYTLVVRMYLLSVIVHMQNNRFVYETGPGTVVQSLEWEEIRRYLIGHGEDRIVAGDYSKFDKRMPASVILAAFDIILDVCSRAGYTEKDLAVVRGIGYDTAYPVVDFNGDLVEFYGSNPSGHPLTVIVNGLANSLYMRYCYIVLRPLGHTSSFKQNVNLLTYGDDNIMGVSKDANWFNHTAIQQILADVDIGYTMADKDAESVPFINIENSNFLKRKWRFDEDIGHWVAPLDHSSLAKMLMVCVQKGNMSPQAHSIEVMQTAVREYFWYGRQVFHEKLAMFGRIVAECNLQPYMSQAEFPTWDDLVHQFWENSHHVDTSLWKH